MPVYEHRSDDGDPTPAPQNRCVRPRRILFARGTNERTIVFPIPLANYSRIRSSSEVAPRARQRTRGVDARGAPRNPPRTRLGDFSPILAPHAVYLRAPRRRTLSLVQFGRRRAARTELLTQNCSAWCCSEQTRRASSVKWSKMFQVRPTRILCTFPSVLVTRTRTGVVNCNNCNSHAHELTLFDNSTKFFRFTSRLCPKFRELQNIRLISLRGPSS